MYLFIFFIMVVVLVNDINPGFHNRLEPIIERWAELIQALFGKHSAKIWRQIKGSRWNASLCMRRWDALMLCSEFMKENGRLQNVAVAWLISNQSSVSIREHYSRTESGNSSDESIHMIQLLWLRSWIREVQLRFNLLPQRLWVHPEQIFWAKHSYLLSNNEWASNAQVFVSYLPTCLSFSCSVCDSLTLKSLHSECKLWNEHRHFFIRGRIRRVETASRRPHSCWRGNSRDLRRRLRKRRGRARRDSAWATIENSRNCLRSKVRRAIGRSVQCSYL